MLSLLPMPLGVIMQRRGGSRRELTRLNACYSPVRPKLNFWLLTSASGRVHCNLSGSEPANGRVLSCSLSFPLTAPSFQTKERKQRVRVLPTNENAYSSLCSIHNLGWSWSWSSSWATATWLWCSPIPTNASTWGMNPKWWFYFSNK